ncbi:hypothetical protein BM526_19320 (plasmid) [Alteromonas mediterranea]|nr:hypothetical protein BM526_19320 [Alteromonas mediterranea]
MPQNNDTLSLIIEHGLTIRQIPHKTVSMYGHRTGRPLMKDGELVERNGMTFQRVVRVPEHAGMWMAKKCQSTSAQVKWCIKRDNLSPTLHEAVLKACHSINEQIDD